MDECHCDVTHLKLTYVKKQTTVWLCQLPEILGVSKYTLQNSNFKQFIKVSDLKYNADNYV
jgi:hypothetical protein